MLFALPLSPCHSLLSTPYSDRLRSDVQTLSFALTLKTQMLRLMRKNRTSEQCTNPVPKASLL